MSKRFVMLCAGTLSSGLVVSASAQPLDFEIDPAQSSMSLTIEIDLGGFGGDTDSDSTALSGMLMMTPDDASAPSEISLNDFDAMMDSDLAYSWVPAIFSTADATLTGGMIQYAEPGTVLGPVPVVDGGFEFLDVPVVIVGMLSVNYDVFLVGADSIMLDLSTLGVSTTPISGMISSSDGEVTVSNTIAFEGSQPLILDKNEVGQILFSGTATMVSVAQAPDCLADLNGDGELDFLDISNFLSGYGSGDLSVDLNGDGKLDFLDISAFLGSYTTGCP